MENKQFCPCDNKKCDDKYDGWCYGSLCSDAIRENAELDSYKTEDSGDGLKVKYNVTKIEDNTPVYNCFVLRPDKDKAAREALNTYANATNNIQLRKDIIKWINSLN